MEIMLNNQSEIKFLLESLNNNQTVLEWGSGGSTIEIAKRVIKLHSIEHDHNWFNKVNSYLPENAELFYVPRNQEEKSGDDGTLTDYYDYVNYPLTLNTKYDVIFIDGRARVECAKIAVGILNEGGYLFIHDYCHPEEQYRRYEYEVVEEFLTKTNQEFALAKFIKK